MAIYIYIRLWNTFTDLSTLSATSLVPAAVAKETPPSNTDAPKVDMSADTTTGEMCAIGISGKDGATGADWTETSR